MGAFTNGGGPPSTQEPEKEIEVQPDTDTGNTDEPKADEPERFATDVTDVTADSELHHGNVTLPVFKVSKNEFYQNMSYGRKRLRFKSGTNAQKYMKGTKYKIPFYVSYTDSKGKTYSRKIK